MEETASPFEAAQARAERLLVDGGGKESFREYVTDLRTLATAPRSGWGAPFSRKGRAGLSGHWSTPRSVLNEISAVAAFNGLGEYIGTDFAADPGSACAPDWYGPFHLDPARRDALQVPWRVAKDRRHDGRPFGWLNCPYHAALQFTAKSAAEFHPGAMHALLSLVFARLDTVWFHKTLPAATSVWARKGRVKFIDPVTGAPGGTAPAPSILITYGRLLAENGADQVGPWRCIYRRRTA